MKTKRSTLTLFSLMVFSISFSQNENSTSELKVVETTSSGVTVYESKGVESKIPINGNNSNQLKIAKLISDWTMEECYSGLFGLNDKIYFLENNNGDIEQIKKYKEVKKEIMERQDFLRTQIGK